MNYHIARDGQQLGVFSREEVIARYNRGEIRATDLAWCEGMASWSAVSEVFGAATAGTAPAAPATPPPVANAPVVPTPLMTGAGPSIAGALPPKPNNYLVPAILVTLFCCLPFGIASIVFAAQVDGKYSTGDYAGAQASADKAKMWMWISIGGWVLAVVAYIIFVAVMVAVNSPRY